tara:strand:+ start:9390 stop:10643 length:1254 start_codon:yes stop_codon:yes gene_type:complete
MLDIIYKNNNKAENLCCLLLSFIPIIFFFGNGVGNTLVIIIDILFLYILIKNKQLNFLNNYLFYLLIIFWFILLGNLIFSINFENSLSRSIGFIRFIFLVFAIKFFFKSEKNNYKDFILKLWFFFLSIISFDIIFEAIIGFNTLGFSSYMPGRLSSFFNQELKIGNLYSSFYLIILSFIIYLKSSNSKFGKKVFKNYSFNYLFFLILFFILISFFIGERSNLIRVIIMSILFFFITSKNWISILKFLITSILITTIFLMSSKNYHWRYWDAFLKPLISNPLEFLNKSYYVSHYKTAIQVFNNHKLYGVGLKNYRLEVQKDEYPDLSSIHPHQIHFEVLAELGSIGYLYFIFFMFVSVLKSFNSYRNKKDYFVLSGMLYVITILLPVLPSGSFFTSFGATVFWVNYALMTSKISSDLK